MGKKQGRAANGMGSIRQRSDGRWEARYTGPDGRQHSLFAKGQTEVVTKLKAALHDVDSGSWKEPTRITVAEWLDTWTENYCGHVSDTSKQFYEKLGRLYIKPQLGNVKLAKLSQVHVRQMVTAMKNRKPRPLSPKTIQSTLGALKVALNAAVQAKIIRENVAAGTPIPRKPKYEMHIIDRPLIPAFVAAAQKTQYPDALVLLLMTGLRSGELRGLEWGDIDWDKSVIHVRRQVHTDKGGGIIVTPPKEGNIRDIVVAQPTMDLLRKHKTRQAEDKLKAGADWYDDKSVHDLVFRMPSGKHLHDRALLGAVYKVAKIINMPGLHTHDLRHSYAVAALRSGIDVKTVQHNLGHASAAMTLDTYAAYTTDAGKTGAQKFAEYWSAANLGQN